MIKESINKRINRVFTSRYLKSFILTLLIVTLVCFLYFIIVKLKYPKIEEYSLMGFHESALNYINTEALTLRADEEIGKGFFEINVSELAKQIKSKDSFIQSIIIEKEFPSKLVIKVKNYQPKVIVDNNSQCVFLDGDAYVIDIYEKDVEGCGNYALIYDAILIQSEDILVNFEKWSDSSFYLVKDILNISKVLDNFSYDLQNCLLSNEVLKCYPAGGRIFIFSVTQSFETQLIRLVSVLEEIDGSNIKFGSLDLRYNRPVIQLIKK